jgi:hypothetical protein
MILWVALGKKKRKLVAAMPKSLGRVIRVNVMHLLSYI